MSAITINEGTIMGELAEVQVGATMDKKMEGVNRYEKTVIDNPLITHSQQKALQDLINRYSDIAAKHEYDVGSTNVIEHEILLYDDTPVKIRRMPYKLLEEAVKQVRHMEDHGLVIMSCNYMVPVVKKEGEIRLCVDYRELNKKT